MDYFEVVYYILVLFYLIGSCIFISIMEEMDRQDGIEHKLKQKIYHRLYGLVIGGGVVIYVFLLCSLTFLKDKMYNLIKNIVK